MSGPWHGCNWSRPALGQCEKIPSCNNGMRRREKFGYPPSPPARRLERTACRPALAPPPTGAQP
eukprot:7488100-Lingulodinium_polyedra.AAC.1